MNKIDIGIVGAGLITREHLTTLTRQKAVGRLSVFDVDQERAGRVAADFRGVQASPSLGQLVEECDLVWVCSPPFGHREAVQAACARKRAIFCEKPLANTVADARAIAAAVRKAGVPFFMGHSGRFTPPFVLMKKLVEDGVVGELRRVWSWRHGWLDPAKAPAWRLDDKLSGGAIVELGVHELDFCRWIGGNATVAHARALTPVLNPGHFQDSVVAMLKLGGGAIATVDLSWADPVYRWQRGVEGTEGCLRFDDVHYREVFLHRPGRKTRTFTIRDKSWKDEKTGENMSFRHQARAVLEALAGGQAPPVTLEDGLQSVELALAVRKAAGGRGA